MTPEESYNNKMTKHINEISFDAIGNHVPEIRKFINKFLEAAYNAGYEQCKQDIAELYI